MENDAGNTLSSRVDYEIIEAMQRLIKYFEKQYGIKAQNVISKIDLFAIVLK